MTEELEKQQEQQQNNNKVEKQFEEAFNGMVALFKGTKSLKRTTIPNDDVHDLVDEMLAERVEAEAKLFKQEASALIDEKIAFDKECKAAEEACKKLILDKKKAFTEKIKKVFNRIENVNTLKKDYYQTLKGAKETIVEEEQQHATAEETPAVNVTNSVTE